jgi:ribosomal protein S6
MIRRQPGLARLLLGTQQTGRGAYVPILRGFLAKSRFSGIIARTCFGQVSAKKQLTNKYYKLVIHTMTKETVKTAGTVYEVGYHIVPAVSPEKLPTEVDAIKAVLGKSGATVISEEFPKLRNLAYTMVKAIGPARHRYDSAYFGWIKFEAAPQATAEIKTALDGNEKVLRYLLIKTARENTLYGPKILPQEKEAALGTDEVKDVKAVMPEELDKTIDKLVA